MSYIYYQFNRKKDVLSDIEIDNNFRTRIIHPRLNNFHNILWYILSFGRLREYQIISDGKLVLSKAQVMPKIFIFKYMKRGGVHIGPCLTLEKFRGKAFYPFLLRQIILDYNNISDFYIFCDDENISSKKAIEKVGFKLIGKGIKKHNIYVIEDHI